MAHWVTINGNHVLLDEEGHSLNDPDLDDDDLDDEIDALMTKEEMDAMFAEAAEAMNRGISVDNLRAEKLGIGSDELDAIEAMMPDFRKMSAEDIKKELFDWWFKNVSKNLTSDMHFPDLKEMALQYSKGIKNKSDNVQYAEVVQTFKIHGTEVRVAQRGKKITGISFRLTGSKPRFDLPYFYVPANTFIGFKISEQGIEAQTSQPLSHKYFKVSHITFDQDGTIKNFDAKGLIPSLGGREIIKKELEETLKPLIIKLPSVLEVLEKLED